SDRGSSGLLGCLGGVFLLTWLQLLAASFGRSLPIVAALALATAAGVQWGWRRTIRSEDANHRPWLVFAALNACLAAWTACLGSLVDLAFWAASRWGIDGVSAGRVLSTLVPVFLLLVASPVFCLARLPFAWVRMRELSSTV